MKNRLILAFAFLTGVMHAQVKELTLKDAVQYALENKAWIEQKINAMVNETPSERKKIIVEKLNEAVSFENFLHTKYVGQKRFSLEGNEAVVPAFDLLIEDAAQLGVEQVVLGMAHRGRLNVLANVFDKSPKNIFSEFDGKDYADESKRMRNMLMRN